MQAFKITLPNGSTLSGHHSPGRDSHTSSPAYAAVDDTRRPLLVAIHGGTYCSTYFDADAKHSAALCSNGLGVPVVAIDRPLYQGTSSFYPIPAGRTYHEELAVQLHKHILPAVWDEFGRGCCGSMVLHCHSLATPSAVILAGWDAQERARGEKPAYPLSGLTISGFGSQNQPQYVAQTKSSALSSSDPPPEWIDFPLDAKDALMIEEGTADPAIYQQTKMLHNRMPHAERADYDAVWAGGRWRALCGAVEVPVMIGMAEKDALWLGTEDHVREFAAGFGRSQRVDASVVRGAPHCIELSYWAQGWYARCFGWALECAAACNAAKGREGSLTRGP
jgi:pimeloyl-ACP methyl ester carboxylesterase